MAKFLDAWTDLPVGEEELRAISQALDEAGVKVNLHNNGSLWVLDVTFERVWGEGGQVPVALNLRIEESVEHARERMGDAAALDDSYTVAESYWRE